MNRLKDVAGDEGVFSQTKEVELSEMPELADCQLPGAFERLETGLVRNAGKTEEIPAVQKLVERQKVRDNERGFSMGTRDANSWKVVSFFPSFTSQTPNTGRRINRFRQ